MIIGKGRTSPKIYGGPLQDGTTEWVWSSLGKFFPFTLPSDRVNVFPLWAPVHQHTPNMNVGLEENGWEVQEDLCLCHPLHSLYCSSWQLNWASQSSPPIYTQLLSVSQRHQGMGP
jgi:hypothetical protein